MTTPELVDKHIEFQVHGELYSKIQIKTVSVPILNNVIKPVAFTEKLIIAIREAIQELEDELGRT